MARRGRGEGTVYQRPDGTWSGQISLGYDGNGKRVRLTVYGATKREVLEKMLQLRQDAAQGVPVRPERMTVAQHFEDWLREKKRSVKSGTYLKYESHWRTHIRPVLGGLRLRDLDHRAVNRLYEQLEKKGLSGTTRCDVAAVLRMGLEDAVRKGLIPKNPARLVTRPKADREEARFLSPEELRWFFEAARGERLEDAFLVLLHTGLRPGEWLGLTWGDVDLERATLTVRQALHEEKGRVFLGEVKTKAARRTITLPKTAVEALRRWRRRQAEERLQAGPAWQDTGLVFTTRSGGLLRRTNIDGRDLPRIIRRARQLAAEAYEQQGITSAEAQERAGKLLEGVTLHSFRHTHASLLIAAGVDIKTISARLGHADIRVTLDIYGHLLPGQDERAAATLDRLMASL